MKQIEQSISLQDTEQVLSVFFTVGTRPVQGDGESEENLT